MKDIPIIFSAPMARALLDGRKTMTRRLAWQDLHYRMNGALEVRCKKPHATHSFVEPSPWQRVKPGDRLWVRENWRPIGALSECAGPDDVRYAASVPEAEWATNKWRPSIHMPRWASRLTLIVAGVKIERLHEISAEDAQAEGLVKLKATSRFVLTPGAQYLGFANRSHQPVFAYLWESLHGEGSWDANPGVVAISFTVHQSNIDAMPSAQAA